MFVVVYSNLNVNLEGIGLVLGQSWMVVLIYDRILFCPPIIMYCEVCCLHIKKFLQKFEPISRPWAIKALKFHIHIC